jgi:hypothetical protein
LELPLLNGAARSILVLRHSEELGLKTSAVGVLAPVLTTVASAKTALPKIKLWQGTSFTTYFPGEGSTRWLK